ncbi:MAG: HAMP domain-containing histidine kinase [Clostridia bacterium]|nr:HAMP domain-containing histidine kinase [Clostridia bacterium]
MDTGSKKYKRDIIKRVIAVLICFLCISGITRQGLSAIDKAEGQNLIYANFSDALNYDLLGIDKNEWTYSTFRNGYTTLLSQLETKMTEFGNGTEKDYKKRLKEYNEGLNKETDFYKDRIIYAATNYFMDFLELYNAGIIEITDMYVYDEADTTNYETLYNNDINYNYYRGIEGAVTEPTLPLSVSEKFKNVKYDNVYYNKDMRCIYEEADEEDIIARYYPGYYAFKVNTEALKKDLISSDAVAGYYSSYEEFYEQYLVSEKRINEHAGSVKYFIRDGRGNVITNIKDFDEKTDKKKITDYFGQLGTYSYSKDGAIYLSNGMYYSDTYLDWFTENSEFSYQREEYTAVTVMTTTLPIETAEANTTLVSSADENGEPITAAVAVPTTGKVYMDDNGDPVTVPETTSLSVSLIRQESLSARDIELYIAFDKNAEYETCHFASVEANVAMAESIIEECLLTAGVFGTLLLICIFYLVAITGKRKGSDEIHLYKTDRMFPEIRIAVDGGLGFLCFMGIYALLEIYIDTAMRHFVGLCILVLILVLFLICLDLLLYLVRHIKNRSLLKNIFIVWCVRKLMKYSRRIKSFISVKILYTKELKKTVIIRTAILIGINIIVGGAAVLFGMEDVWEMCGLVMLALFIFDLWVVYRGLRFVAGAEKLFSVVRDLHEGNTDVHINKNALPDYLYVPAEDLQCLSEGIKAAVDEAVKQEKTKTELITNVSHDLKTPLTSIINYVDLMKKCDITDETALSYLQVLSEKSDRLKVLIEDLVEASKASAGALSVDYVCVSCRELISQLLGEFEEGFEEKGLQVIFSIPESDVKIKADSKHIYRVLENLFVNVRKYALGNTRVYIIVSEKGDRGIINIKNISAAPLNISADELKERFVRGEQSRTTEGNGLGLSIAENLCTLQNGSLGIEINGDLFSITVEMEKFS